MGLGSYLKSKIQSEPVRPKIGLALGGGGARGYAHIGVLRAFEEENIDFKICAGTSVGSIIGALYCAGVTSSEIEKAGIELDLKDVHNGFFLTPNDPLKIGRIVEKLIGDANIEHLPKKFCAVAVDLIEGKEIYLEKGSVKIACSASSCVPMFFRPVEYNNMHLLDGGLLNNIPSDVCKMMGADKVVAVDINPARGGGTAELGLIDVLKSTFSIMQANAAVKGIRMCDVLIAPDTSQFRSTSKFGYDRMIEIGYRAAKEKISEIKQLFI